MGGRAKQQQEPRAQLVRESCSQLLVPKQLSCSVRIPRLVAGRPSRGSTSRCVPALCAELQTPRGGSGRSPRAPLQNESTSAPQSPGLLPAERCCVICWALTTGALPRKQLREAGRRPLFPCAVSAQSSRSLIRVTSSGTGRMWPLSSACSNTKRPRAWLLTAKQPCQRPAASPGLGAGWDPFWGWQGW